jgi:hypothetical protein
MHFSSFTGMKLFIISLCTLPKYLDSIIGQDIPAAFLIMSYFIQPYMILHYTAIGFTSVANTLHHFGFFQYYNISKCGPVIKDPTQVGKFETASLSLVSYRN